VRLREVRTHSRRCAALLGLAGSLAAVVLALGAGPAAASGTVTCPPDDGTDLQTAINGGGTVTVNGTCHGNFDVANDVTIQGGSPGATLDGDAAGSVLTIHNDATVTIKNLRITNGFNSNSGGGIDEFDCSTHVTLTNSTVTGNLANDEGGGVFFACGVLDVVASKVTGNSAFLGAGMEIEDSLVHMINSTVSGNTTGSDGAGGGMRIVNSDATLTGVTVSNNQAGDEGGGIYVENTDLQVTGSTITGNRTTELAVPTGGGGIWMGNSQVSLDSTRVSWNSSAAWGGGIAYYGHEQLQQGLTLTNSTVDHNTAAFSGGGIYSRARFGDATVTIDRSTVSFNRVTDGDGGGLSNYGECDDTASVVATNSAFGGNLALDGEGGAIYNSNGGCSGGAATVTLAKTRIGQIGTSLNPNQARYGGGIFNENGDGFASLSVQPGSSIVHNRAIADGGGIFNCAGADLSIAPGVSILLNSPNNVVTRPCY